MLKYEKPPNFYLNYIYIIFIIIYGLSRSLPFINISGLHTGAYNGDYLYGWQLFGHGDISFLGYPFLISSIFLNYRLNFKPGVIFGLIGSLFCAFIQIIWLGNVMPNGWIIGYYYSSICLIEIIILNIIGLVLFCVLRINADKEQLIRNTIIKYSKITPRFKISEISEKTNIDIRSVRKITKKMIKNQEIKALYFESSNSIVFNQIDDADRIKKYLEIIENQKNKMESTNI